LISRLPSDLYGTDFALDENGDLELSPSGRIATVAGDDNVKEAIIRRLATAGGEMYRHPEYGAGLVELWGEDNNDVTWAKARRVVRKALSEEPRVKEVVDVYVKAIDGNRFDIYAFYTLIEDDNTYNLVYPFFVR
jgi:phage baseplate assembly protein W